MFKILLTSLYISIALLFGANYATDELVLMNTFPKQIDQSLYQDVTYVQQRCDILKISDFCNKMFNKITKLQIKEHRDFHFGLDNSNIIGIAWNSPITDYRHVFISTAVSWNDEDRRTTMVHELGHVLDLGHFDIQDDIMNSLLNNKINLTNLDGYTDIMLMRAYNQSVSTK